MNLARYGKPLWEACVLMNLFAHHRSRSRPRHLCLRRRVDVDRGRVDVHRVAGQAECDHREEDEQGADAGAGGSCSSSPHSTPIGMAPQVCDDSAKSDNSTLRAPTRP